MGVVVMTPYLVRSLLRILTLFTNNFSKAWVGFPSSALNLDKSVSLTIKGAMTAWFQH
jgi:hypothetical protein